MCRCLHILDFFSFFKSSSILVLKWRKCSCWKVHSIKSINLLNEIIKFSVGYFSNNEPIYLFIHFTVRYNEYIKLLGTFSLANKPICLFIILNDDKRYSHCVKSVQIRSCFWSVFYCVWTEYKEILRIQSKWGKMRTRNNSVFGHFSRSEFSGKYMKVILWKVRLMQSLWYQLHWSTY